MGMYNTCSNKSFQVLAMRTDSVAMLEALDAISEFYSDNTVDARRMLKQDLELQNIQLAKKYFLLNYYYFAFSIMFVCMYVCMHACMCSWYLIHIPHTYIVSNSKAFIFYVCMYVSMYVLYVRVNIYIGSCLSSTKCALEFCQWSLCRTNWRTPVRCSRRRSGPQTRIWNRLWKRPPSWKTSEIGYFKFMNVCVMYACVCSSIYVCKYVCVYVCICVCK